MGVISQSILKTGKGGQKVEGVILVKNYSVSLTKTGKEYISGQLQSGSMIPFKVWSSSEAFGVLKNNDLINKPCAVVGSFDDFGGTISIVINSIAIVDGYTPSQFFENKYDKKAYQSALKGLCNQYLSVRGNSLIDGILFSDKDLFSRFSEEFSAMSHHDNCMSGLLAHTYKVVNLVVWTIQMYPNILIDENGSLSKDRQDLLIIGSILHDIGKVMEMQFGVYQPNSAVTHRILGLDILYKYRDKIEGTYNSKWFRDLQSILVEHHGVYGDSCRTVVSYIVHMADMYDAGMTGLIQKCETPIVDTAGKKVKMDDFTLFI